MAVLVDNRCRHQDTYFKNYFFKRKIILTMKKLKKTWTKNSSKKNQRSENYINYEKTKKNMDKEDGVVGLEEVRKRVWQRMGLRFWWWGWQWFCICVTINDPTLLATTT